MKRHNVATLPRSQMPPPAWGRELKPGDMVTFSGGVSRPLRGGVS